MKKIFYSFTAGLALTGLALAGLFTSCTNVNDEFNKSTLDSLSNVRNRNTKYTYTLVDADYTAIAKLVQKPIADQITPINATLTLYKDSLKNATNHADSVDYNAHISDLNSQIATLKLDPTYVMGGLVSSNKYLPVGVLAGEYVPSWMNTNKSSFIYADIDNSAALTFNGEYDTLAPVEIQASSKYTLKAADYTAMKVTAGTGGSYFNSTYSPTYYIPKWLAQSFPYAKVGDLWLIHYKYYVSSTSTVNRWMVSIYDGTKWSSGGSLTPTTLQYVYKADGWHMDPTVRLTLSKADFNILVDKTKAFVVLNPSQSYLVDSYGTAEFYYGASAYYGEYQISPSLRMTQPEYSGLSTDEINQLIWDRVSEGNIIILQTKYPNAVTQVNGIDVHYKVTYMTYITSVIYYTSDYKCTSNGAIGVPPNFELVGTPVKQ
jgi:hypothetical protein